DERKHLARGRHAARPGVSARCDGRVDPRRRPLARATHDALRRGGRRANRAVVRGSSACARRAGRYPRAAAGTGGRIVTRKWTIAVLGGTGAAGGGLSLRWALQGHDVIIGSRDPGRATAAAAELTRLAGGKGSARGATHRDAAQA